jgi:spore germination cell wall hydrolase CwlJ-like protein
MAAPAVPVNLAAALKYGPQTQTAVRRSQYLADALRQLSEEGGKITGGYGELGSKLLAQAILQRAGKKADLEAVGALRGEQDTETERMIAALGGRPQSTAPATALAAAPPIQLPPSQPEPAPLAAQPPPEAPKPAAYSPQDRDALTRMLATEAIGEGPDGMAAAGHVALNRLKAGFGGAKSLVDVVNAPHQFEGMSRAGQVNPQDYARAGQVADALLNGGVPDPTNGALNFLNPELQQHLGRQLPTWAQGQGQRIGRHVFFGGQPQQVAQGAQPVDPNMAAGESPYPPPPPPPDDNGPPVQTVGPQPSAPVRSPPAAGSAAAGMLPQTPPAAAGPTSMGITPEQIGLVEKLMRDPRTHEVGVAYAMELQKKAAEPTKYETQNVNGVPAWLDPYHPGNMTTGGVPEQARSRIVKAEDIGYPAPPGTMLSIDPAGNVKEVGRPQQGQMVTSAPGQSYRETPVPGSGNDPHSPANTISGEGKLRDDYDKQIAPYILARQGYQKVVEAVKTGNPAGDIALVFNVMKVLDPGSTVREGEQAQVTNSGTIPQTVTNMYNKLIAGQGSLAPEQRAMFADMAGKQFGVYQQSLEATNKRYGELATSYGFDPTRVVRSFDAVEAYHPPGGGLAPIPEAARQSYQRLYSQGRIDTKKPVGDQANPFQARDDATLHALDVPANKGKYVITPHGDLVRVD